MEKFDSDYAKEYYIGHYATDRDNRKYTVCRLGVPKRTQQNYLLNDKFVLLSCSYAIPLKRIEIIIKSLSELNTERIHWIHIGDGDWLYIRKEKLTRLLLHHLPKEDVLYPYRKHCLLGFRSLEPM